MIGGEGGGGEHEADVKENGDGGVIWGGSQTPY